jgi:hypothetical protein
MKRTRFPGILLIVCLLLIGLPCHAQGTSGALRSRSIRFSPEVFQRKMATFQGLTVVLDTLYRDMDRFCARPEGFRLLSLADEEFLGYWMFSLKAVKSSLRRVGREVKRLVDVPPAYREKVTALGFATFVEWYRPSVYIWKKPGDQRALRKKLNEPVIELGLTAGEGNRHLVILNRSELRDHLVRGSQEVEKAMAATDSDAVFLRNRILSGYQYVRENAPSSWKIHAHLLLKKVGGSVFARFYQVESAVSVWIGDTKYLPKNPTITHERVREMKTYLQPGDILLERENWFLSNLFLPGFWKHGILYTGSLEDLRRLGLATHPNVSPHLAEYARTDAHGFQKCLIEAISDGVVMGSMEEATDADYICALRPRKTTKQIAQAIAMAFQHLGRPYDFLFDFHTADKIVCTELLYRSFREDIGFTLQRVMGRWALPADDILRKFVAERGHPDRDFDFVFFLDSDPKTRITKFRTEQDLVDSLKRPSADFMLSMEEE